MDLKVYTLGELEPHLFTLYSNPETILPVSPLRMRSYLENPRASSSDPVLFEIRQDGEVVAFRSLLPDIFFDREGNPHRFAWLSGNWVEPGLRRQGISTRLLELAEERWEGQLMYTNYAPESKAVYDRTGRFRVIADREGKRFYLRSDAETLLSKRLGFKKLFRASDRVINQRHERSLESYLPSLKVDCELEQVQGILAQLAKLVNRHQQQSLFRRDREIFEWALQYPWVTEQDCDPINYQFSYKASRFENIIYHVVHPEGDTHGILWMLIHNNSLSVPYQFSGNAALHKCMADTIVRTMIENGCTYTTIRYPELTARLMAHQKAFLSVRNMPQLIFAHEKLASLIPEGSLIHDGDGDVMFTG
jgi:GNAT superfamily N-acetyltransferase